MPDYKDSAPTIVTTVYDRVKFLTVDADTDSLIHRMIVLTAHELEKCFKVAIDPNTGDEDEARIAVEENYNFVQKSLIAYMVAVDMLAPIAAKTAYDSSSAGDGGGQTGTFLSKAKAGSAEVAYTQFDSDVAAAVASTFTYKATDLVAEYKSAAARIGAGMGCDVFPDMESDNGFPFIVVNPNS